MSNSNNIYGLIPQGTLQRVSDPSVPDPSVQDPINHIIAYLLQMNDSYGKYKTANVALFQELTKVKSQENLAKAQMDETNTKLANLVEQIEKLKEKKTHWKQQASDSVNLIHGKNETICDLSNKYENEQRKVLAYDAAYNDLSAEHEATKSTKNLLEILLGEQKKEIKVLQDQNEGLRIQLEEKEKELAATRKRKHQTNSSQAKGTKGSKEKSIGERPTKRQKVPDTSRKQLASKIKQSPRK